MSNSHFPRFAAGLLTAAGLALALAAPASAAQFLDGGDADLGCILTVQGPIRSGDADGFRAALDRVVGDPYAGESDFLDRWDQVGGLAVPRICLDSPGGSLAEALKMADVLADPGGDNRYLYSGIGTAIARDATCYSACAVLFMAGGVQSESSGGRLPNRVLHAQGLLGFHAPGLTIADGNYSAEAVDRAFAIAVRSIGELSDRQGKIRFPATLMNRMVATPPQDMYVLQTVGEASQWMIDIAGLPYPAKVSRGHFVNACLNAQPGLRPSTGYYQIYATRHDGAGRDFFSGRRLGDYSGSLLSRHYGRGEAEIALGRSGDFGDASFVSDPDPAEDGLNCEVGFGGRWPMETPMRGNTRRLSVSFLRGDAMALDQAALYPPWTRFAELAARHGSGALPADATVWTDRRSLTTRCLVYNSADQKTDDDPCDAMESAVFTGDGTMQVTVEFTWPSGASTVVEMDGTGPRINGNSATVPYIEGVYDISDHMQCLRNSRSGNAFCFDMRAY
ncbi:hypothetical protein [Antarctobacter sp.]|uniref:COG3904 family protein n=1 Tax=Antarctobacter sp. TaxID=1872577 RepID=UPI003A8F7407